MGMFDSFVVKNFKCPNCGKKPTNCYDLYDKVPEFQDTDNKGHYHRKGVVNIYGFCWAGKDWQGKERGGCGKEWNLLAIIREGRYIGWINTEGLEDFNKEEMKLWRRYLRWEEAQKKSKKEKKK